LLSSSSSSAVEKLEPHPTYEPFQNIPERKEKPMDGKKKGSRGNEQIHTFPSSSRKKGVLERLYFK